MVFVVSACSVFCGMDINLVKFGDDFAPGRVAQIRLSFPMGILLLIKTCSDPLDEVYNRKGSDCVHNAVNSRLVIALYAE